MSKIIILAAKYGSGALPIIFSEFGFFAGIFAFFAFMPLGHFTIGVLLVIIGAFVPKIPDSEKLHDIQVSGLRSTLKANGTGRTALFSIGALVILCSFFEAAR